MAGQPGRSGGHNRRSLAEHLMQGSYRRDRHGPLPGAVLPMPLAANGPVVPEPWTPDAATLKGLTAAGRQLVAGLLTRYAFSPVEGLVVIEAAHAVGRLASIRRGQAAASGAALAKLHRLELAWQRQFAKLLAQLRVETD